MSNDPLSDVLQLTAAKTVVTGGFAANGSWGFRFAAPHEIKFAIVLKGTAWFRLDGQQRATRVDQGDIGLMSGSHGYVIGSSTTVKPIDGMKLVERWARIRATSSGAASSNELAAHIARLPRFGDKTGPECVIIAGGVALDPASAEILTGVLPPLIHVGSSNPRAPALRWLVEQLLEDRASTRAGTGIASSLHAQLLFVQILRAHLESSGALPSGWLRAIRDERIARALQLMHREPGRAWRLGELAKAAAMSRTSFAVEFKAIAGIAPLTYLAEWRMRLAQQRLRDQDAAVSEIATALGYTSESAFSHAFKRVVGSSPRDYRRTARA